MSIIHVEDPLPLARGSHINELLVPATPDDVRVSHASATVPALLTKYRRVRSMTRSLVSTLSTEDQMIQSCRDASPVKWHQAHTTWFFETFVLNPFLIDYKPFNEAFRALFNSYYISLGEAIPAKKLRSSFSRPSLEEVEEFRTHVDREMERLLTYPLDRELFRRILLGLNHEQQHQELALTDIKHAFFSNPLRPLYRSRPLQESCDHRIQELQWVEFAGGLTGIGYALDPNFDLDFCFDNEGPRHKTYLEPFQLASRKATCEEYLEFMNDGGYSRPEFWLSDGWETTKRAKWKAPLYWERDQSDAAGWRVFTLGGWCGLSGLLNTAVCHLSYFEADAFAKWNSCRLPTEAEWESVASEKPIQGNFMESGRLHPSSLDHTNYVDQLFGDCWEWTSSAYTAYPGYKRLPGALGEYNAKFMSSQMILRGGSCATPADHMRVTYRNFFSPATRWQFSGVRLAK